MQQNTDNDDYEVEHEDVADKTDKNADQPEEDITLKNKLVFCQTSLQPIDFGVRNN